MKRAYRTKNAGLSNINKTLTMQNEIMRQMLVLMPKPAGRFTKAFETIALVAGAFSIVNTIESMVKWFIGG